MKLFTLLTLMAFVIITTGCSTCTSSELKVNSFCYEVDVFMERGGRLMLGSADFKVTADREWRLNSINIIDESDEALTEIELFGPSGREKSCIWTYPDPFRGTDYEGCTFTINSKDAGTSYFANNEKRKAVSGLENLNCPVGNPSGIWHITFNLVDITESRGNFHKKVKVCFGCTRS